MDHTRWVLHAEFDELGVQEAHDPELAFPLDECSALIAHLCNVWCLSPEELQEFIEWTSVSVKVHADVFDQLQDPLQYLLMNSVPKKITITRNEER